MNDLTRIGLDIGASHVRVAVTEGARIRDLAEYRLNDLGSEHGDVLDRLGDAIGQVACQLPGPVPPIGVGVACVVDADGTMLAPLGTSIPVGTALRDRIATRFQTRVVVDNDASMAALGEATYGAGQGQRNLTLITLGSNIGMGIVANGSIYRGARGAAGEVGTLPVRLSVENTPTWQRIARARQAATQPIPPHGYVWIEELYGGKALSAALTNARRRNTTGAPTRNGRLERVLQAAHDGEPAAQAIVEDALTGWALTLATVCAVLDPGLILLGGGITDDLRPYLDRLRTLTAALIPGRCPPIELAALGSSAGLIGAGVAAR